MTRIAIVRQRLTQFGGAGPASAQAVAALQAHGLDVTLVVRKSDPTPAADRHILCCNPFYLGRTWRDLSFAQAVRRLIDQQHFDLLQSHERIPGCHVFRADDGVHADWLAMRHRAYGRWMHLRTALSPWHRYTLRAEAQMFLHPNLRAVICISTMLRDDISARFPSLTARLHVIPIGIDPMRFSPHLRAQQRVATRAHLGITEQTPLILFVGSGFARKGLTDLLAAMTRLHTSEAHLWVAGTDSAMSRYRKLAERLGVARRVHFLGGVTDTASLYGAADVFCLPTLYDPQAIVVVEALASGLPVVTTTRCGAAEFVRADVSGAVVSPLHPPALSAALDEWLTLTTDTAKPEERAQHISVTVAHLTQENSTRQLLALYSQLGLLENAPRPDQEFLQAAPFDRPALRTTQGERAET